MKWAQLYDSINILLHYLSLGLEWKLTFPVLWPVLSFPNLLANWVQEEKGATEDEMVGWHHRLNGHEFEQSLAAHDGQGSLACCSVWSHKESDTTERLNWTELNTVKGFSIVNEVEIDMFWNSLAFPMIQSYLISGSFAFSKSILYI